MALDQVGVELIAQNRSEYVQAITEAQKRTESLISSLRTTPQATQGMTVGITAASVALGNFATQAVMGALNSINQLTRGVEGFVMQSIEAAGRLDQLTRVAYLMGEQQGYSSGQVDKMVESIRKQGIEAVTATQIITDFARAGFDMSKALELAKVAQDAAQISGENSTQTLERLKWGIMTMQPEVLRTAGIMVNLEQSTKKYAEANKVAVSALTPAQRQQAVLNAVLEEGTKIAGAYSMALDSGYKLWLSLTRIINDIQIAIGKPFQDAWYNVSRLLYEGGKAVTAMLSEGGKLKPILDGLGATAAVVTGYIQEFTVGILGSGQTLNQFGQIVDKNGKILADQAPTMLQGILTFVSDSATALTNMADDALVWGFNIIAQLASGISEGVATVLVTAMNGVSEMLSWFLAPGSPPNVAPKIDLWGALAMTEFLRGFEKADFSVMDQIQGSLQQALGMLTSTGHLDAEGSAQIFQRISEGLIRTMKSGDFSGILSQIKSELGAYGQEVGLLIEKQLKLKSATDALTKSQENYKKAIEDARNADSEMNKIMDEYNALATSGATQDVLKKKKEEFDLAKKRRDEAIKTAKTEEKNITEQQKNVESLSKEAELQQQLLKQVYELTKAKSDEAKAADAAARAAELAAKKAAGAGAGAGKAGLATPAKKDIVQETGFLKNKMDETAGSIKKTFENLKADIKKQLEDAFKPVVDAWNNDIVGNIRKVEESWKNFSTTVDSFYKTYVKPVVDEIIKLIPLDLVKNIGIVVGAIMTIGAAFYIVQGIIAVAALAIATPIGQIILAITAIVVIVAWLMSEWNTIWTAISTFFVGIWEGSIKPVFDAIVLAVGTFITDAVNTMLAIWQSASDWFSTVLLPLFQAIADFLVTVFAVAVLLVVKKFREDWLPVIQEVAQWLGEKLKPVIDGVRSALEFLSPIVDFLGRLAFAYLSIKLEEVVKGFEEFGKWIGETFQKALSGVNDFILKLTDGFKALTLALKLVTLPLWLTPGSPTPLEIALVGLSKILDIVVGLFPKFKLPDFNLDAKKMMESVKKAFDDVFDMIRKFGADAAEAWKSGVELLVTHSTTMFASLVVAFQVGLVAVNTATQTGLTMMMEAWKQFWLMLVTYIYNEAIPAVIQAVEELIRRAKQAMIDAVNNGGFDEVGKLMVQYIIQGLVDSTQTLIDSATQMLSQVAVSAEANAAQYFFDLGYNLVMDMIEGLWAGYPLYVAALSAFEKQQPEGGEKRGTGGSGGGKGQMVATGGPIFAGQKYLAGESVYSRPETFVASQSGYMLTRQDAIAALAQAINTPVFRNQNRAGAGTEATASKLRLAGAGMMGGNSQSIQNYNLTLNSRIEPATVSQGFQVFKLLGSV